MPSTLGVPGTHFRHLCCPTCTRKFDLKVHHFAVSPLENDFVPAQIFAGLVELCLEVRSLRCDVRIFVVEET
jgi:hypothetical protein